MLFFFKIIGERASSTIELTEFCQMFESEMISFCDFVTFRKGISTIYINQHILFKARKIEYTSLIESQLKQNRQKKQSNDKCIDESPFCFGTRHFRTQKESNFCVKSSNFVEKIKFNYFDPFSCRNASLSSNPIPLEEMLNLKHLTNQFTSYRNGSTIVDDLQVEKVESSQLAPPQFDKQISFQKIGDLKNHSDSFHYFDAISSQKTKKYLRQSQIPAIIPLLKIHTTESDVSNSLFLDHNSSQIENRFDPLWKSMLKPMGNSSEDIQEKDSNFFMLLKNDSEKNDIQQEAKVELTTNDPYYAHNFEINRLKSSKSESHAHQISKFILESVSEQQHKKELQQNELLLVRSDHICHLRGLSYLLAKEQRKIKQLFFEKSRRLIKKQLGLVISVYFYQNEKSSKRMKTIEENDCQTITKILNSTRKLNYSLSMNVLRFCRSQEKCKLDCFDAGLNLLPKKLTTLLGQPSDYNSSSIIRQPLDLKKTKASTLIKIKSMHDPTGLATKPMTKNVSSQMNIKQSPEVFPHPKKNSSEWKFKSDIKDKTRKPPAKISK